MRIIGGKYKGKSIVTPRGLPVRPTTDFAKESLFNILNNLIDFEEIKLLKKPYKQSSQVGIDVRRIGAGSQILRDLGVKKLILMGSETRYPSISGFGLEVIKYIQK